MNMLYKQKYDDVSFRELNFLKKKVINNGIPNPAAHEEQPIGIDPIRKTEILRNLGDLIPSDSRQWWLSLQTKKD
jgi:hypothetical protein